MSLENADRGVRVDRPIVLGQHPSETNEHLLLRLLAYCLLYEDGIGFGPGVCEGDAPDLFARDLTGKLTLWVGCGDLDAELARKVVQHNREATVHGVFSRKAAREAFDATVARWDKPPRGWDRFTSWTIDEALVRALVGRDHLRQRWSVTVVGDHLYVLADGTSFDGAVERRSG